MDYSGERFRAYLNADYSLAATKNFLGGTGIAAGVDVPAAPDNRNNWAQTWGFEYPQTKQRLVGRVEWDFADDWTVSLAYGQLDQRDGEYTYCGSTIVNSAGDVSYLDDCYRGGTQTDTTSADARIAGKLKTGPINHRLVLGAAGTKAEYGGPFDLFVPAGQTSNNIYNPIRYPAPDNIPSVAPDAYAKNYEERVHSFYVGDELGFMDNRLLVTLGLRRVDFEFGDFDPTTGQRSSEVPSVFRLPRAGVHAICFSSSRVLMQTLQEPPPGKCNRGWNADACGCRTPRCTLKAAAAGWRRG